MMNDQGRTIFLLAVASSMLVIAGRTHAAQFVPLVRPPPSIGRIAGDLDGPLPGNASRAIHHAVRNLEKATLQLEFASNDQELNLLYSAHDLLATAMDRLCCLERERAAALVADIDHVILRDKANFGPYASPAGDRFGPPAPTRAQLVRLVKEGQDLARIAPDDVRPRSGDAPDSADRAASVARGNANAMAGNYSLPVNSTAAIAANPQEWRSS